MSKATVQQLVTEIQALSPDQRAEVLQQLNSLPAETKPFSLPITPRLIGRYTPKDRTQEWQWLAQHSDAYAGQWVALEGDRLLASGPVFKEVLQAARQAGVPDALLVRAQASEALPFAGF